MTAEEALSLFGREKGQIFALWRLPALGGIFRGSLQAATGAEGVSTILGRLPEVFRREAQGKKAETAALSIPAGEGLRQGLWQAALGQFVRLPGGSGEGVGPLTGREADFRALPGGGYRAGVSGGSGIRRGVENLPALLAETGETDRAKGGRLRQAAAGRETLLAQSLALLQRQRGESGDFDGLLSRLERQLAIELGAG